LDEAEKYHGEGTNLFESLVKIVYGNKSIDDYNNDFIRAANGIEDSGYIEGMQKTILHRMQNILLW